MSNATRQAPNPQTNDTSIHSTFYEQLVEHVFISEVLQECWYRHGVRVEVLKAEIDASGYDIVFECNGIMRHIQLKTSKVDGKTAKQNCNIALAEKPSGCMVWIVRDECPDTKRMKLSYRYFGAPLAIPCHLWTISKQPNTPRATKTVSKLNVPTFA